MLGWARKTRCEAVCELAPLRVSDDLSADETEMVDRHVQRCAACRAVLDSFEQSHSILTEASLATASISDEMPDGTLWSRIEPRLGPAGRFRRRSMNWISTPQLAAACLGLFGFTVYNESAQRLNGSRSMASATLSTRPTNIVPAGKGVGINVGSVAAPRMEIQQTGGLRGPIPGKAINTEFIPDLGLVLADTVGRISGHRFQEYESGPVVVGVVQGWLGGRCGIRDGDAIVAVNDRPIYSPADVLCALEGCRDSQQTTLRVLRGGSPHNLVIHWRKVAEKSEESRDAVRQSLPNSARESLDRLRIRFIDPR